MPEVQYREANDTRFRQLVRRTPCPACKARKGEWCKAVDGRSRVSNHNERLLAAGFKRTVPRRKTAAEISPERLAEYREQRRIPCDQCEARAGEPCLGATGQPIQSTHIGRFKVWKYGG